jgi:uncharacterized protein YggU (UPF0235/DUF167 family)
VTGSGPVRASARGVRIEIRVVPRSPRTGVDGVRDGRLLVRVTAPPVDSAANEAVVAVLADVLDVAKRSVRLVSVAAARNKVVEVDGVHLADVLTKLRQRDQLQR